MKYVVELTPEAQKDFFNLDNSQRIQILKSFQKLENHGMLVGESLHGDLSGYRKIKHKRLGLRVIFHLTDNGIEVIEIIAIGKRSDNEIYKIAEKRIKNN